MIGLGLILVSACQTSTPVRPTPVSAATVATEQRNDGDIQLSDNGKTFSYHLTDRFSVFLDDTKDPVKDLSCTPDGVIGYVSNGSLGGPGHYPIMFEAVKEGNCRLADHDFHVDIVVEP
jgi:hypothetical protein